MEISKEVVDGLREDPSPVDRVHCTETVFWVEFAVTEERLDNILCAYWYRLAMKEYQPETRMGRTTYLTVIEGTLHGKIVHVRVRDSGHLSFLDGRHAAFRVQDENRDICLVPEAVNRCASA